MNDHEQVPHQRRWRILDRPFWKVQLQFEPGDLWVGVFVKRTGVASHFYLCVLPMFPIHIVVANAECRAGIRRERLRITARRNGDS